MYDLITEVNRWQNNGTALDASFLSDVLVFKVVSFDSPVLPRPGLALGRYPERSTHCTSPLDDWFDRNISSLVARWKLTPPSLENIIADIERAGEPLAKASEGALSKRIEELRSSLLLAGWNHDLAVASFALIRELSDRHLGLRHFESQLQGGWAMLQGQLAQMQTGEGKTIAAALPAATAALCAIPVHVITANDYLAARDAQLLRPLYEALGLTVGVIHEGMDFHDRRKAYACDITYCTNKQVAFDYLRDRLQGTAAHHSVSHKLQRTSDGASAGSDLMLRGLCFAIVDEADSVLIDEARTPLVLSRTVESDDSMIESYRQALILADGLEEKVDFVFEAKTRQVSLTPKGSSRLAKHRLNLNAPWHSSRQREELVIQALSALHLFIKDIDYVVRDDKVLLVDGNTGRVMSDRTWELGIQQMVEAKENCIFSQQKETLARISYQRFFKRYLKLSGMTGTAMDVRQELAMVYGLRVVPIRPNRNSLRIAMPEYVYCSVEHASTAIVSHALEQASCGRPVLIGTRSVQKSEYLAQLFRDAGSDVLVLNARQDKDEATIIQQAGKAGQITVATNMAGRGTDILLGPGVAEKGGLHVIIFEHNDAARLDQQLYGRCARQGDPGSYQIYSSLEDELIKTVYGHWLCDLINKLGWNHSKPFRSAIWHKLVRIAQRRTERIHRKIRRQVELEETHLQAVLSFSGKSE